MRNSSTKYEKEPNSRPTSHLDAVYLVKSHKYSDSNAKNRDPHSECEPPYERTPHTTVGRGTQIGEYPPVKYHRNKRYTEDDSRYLRNPTNRGVHDLGNRAVSGEN
ncbi:hypothetical protein GCM10009039_24250 [Halocalculus aciditolerans]|uniref:Uncharacterized protein n=1 Tax=Halocalculus aciditolerans TaxID=1383812 RepID=A0A830FKQ2_9EURY|nr:hypothetical protein GCM10009039_24250 [Halocalculus aciditolerans]